MKKPQLFLIGFWFLLAYSIWKLAVAQRFPTVLIYGPWLLGLAAYYGLLVFPFYPPELKNRGAEWWDLVLQKYSLLKHASLLYYSIYLIAAIYIGIFHPEFQRNIGSHYGPIMIVSLLPVLAMFAATHIEIYQALGRD